MEKKSRAELVTWHCGRLSEMQMPHRHCPEGIDSLPCGAASARSGSLAGVCIFRSELRQDDCSACCSGS